MDDFKEFQGSNLDDAIKQACSYYNATRDKLEIDIIQDSKTGIFGIVGARKAKIKARKVQLRGKIDDILGNDRKNDERVSSQIGVKKNENAVNDDSISSKDIVPPKNTNAKKSNPVAAHKPSMPTKNNDLGDAHSSINDEDEIASYGPGNELAKNNSSPNNHRRGINDNNRTKNTTNVKNNLNFKKSTKPVSDKSVKSPISDKKINSPVPENKEDILADDTTNEGLVLIPFEEIDQEALKSICYEAVRILTAPIVGEVPIYVEILEGRVNVSLDCGDDSGLLIGREGQTLASIQYLASRVVSRKMQSAVRIQLDAGEYRLRQDEKLKSIALTLAERVRSSGRSYSTRPLSSYHRRIVHMALQESLDVQTRSSGEGALKRVIIQRKRG